MKPIIVLFILLSNFFSSQYITGLNLTQNGEDQIKTNLKVYLPTVGEFRNYTTNINQNVITLSACYFLTDFGGISDLENDFMIDIPNNQNYTLIVNIYSSSDPAVCNYDNLEDTKTLSFSTPIEGVISLSTTANSKKNDLSLFPIPAKDVLNIQTDLKIDKVNLYDGSGKLLFNKTKNTSNINTSGLKNGVYYLEIVVDKKIFRKKFTIQK